MFKKLFLLMMIIAFTVSTSWAFPPWIPFAAYLGQDHTITGDWTFQDEIIILDADGDSTLVIGFVADDYLTFSVSGAVSGIRFSEHTTILDTYRLSIGSGLDMSFRWVENSTNDDIGQLYFIESNGTNIPILNISDASYAPNGDSTNDDATEPGIRLWTDDALGWNLWAHSGTTALYTTGGTTTSVSIPDYAPNYPFTIPEDAGALSLFNMLVSADATDGDEMSMSFLMDSDVMMALKSKADGAGGVDEKWFYLDSALVFSPSSDQTRADDSTITIDNVIIRVAGDGGAAVLDVDPAIEDGVEDGQIVIIQGTHDTNTVQIVDAVNTQLAAAAAMTLGKGDSLYLAWDSGESNWYEISRSDN
ncbi:MAG: hypothetical protein DRQ47_06005 [Gammaproteobacteria bacterium]|nr:MAG: hypothetical protein DRQ47_06005 [Gammaproteobacteria bacterium]